MTFFRGMGGGYSFYIKCRLKSEMINNKKRFVNKNMSSSWEILNKNLI